MTARFVSPNLDLSTLPAPDVIKVVDFETILAERLADLVARAAAVGITLDTTGLETEPAVILEQADAYREVLTRAAINDAARSVMLAHATGGNLDNLGLFYGVSRLVIRPADNTTSPPTPAVMESDSDLRARIILAPEQLPYAGLTGGGYRALALRTAPSVKDATTIKRGGGQVDLILLGRDGDGTVSDTVVSSVFMAFQDDAATQLTDIITVRAARIVPYSPTITIRIPLGPDPTAVATAAEAAVRTYAASRARIGATVYAQMLEAAASVGPVESASCDIGDVEPGADGAAFLAALAVVPEVSDGGIALPPALPNLDGILNSGVDF